MGRTEAKGNVGFLWKKRRSLANRRLQGFSNCRGTKIRTWDPLLPKQVR